jgi:NADH dehydrogenase [ubiquinone] 1 alpha subcomplex assembly factor 5
MDDGNMFNRALYRKRRMRAAKASAGPDFLRREAMERLAECLEDIARIFPLALHLGAHTSALKEILRGRGGIERLVGYDMAEGLKPDVVGDEELLPFAENSFDLILSGLSLHHVNDLPGTLIQARRALKPKGAFIAILPGASSLKELRASVTGAAAERNFPLSPRISPFVEVRDAGALLMRAGFALPVADSDTARVDYDNAAALMRELHGAGEGNVLAAQHRGLTTPAQLFAIAGHYDAHYARAQGGISATVEFVTMTGWKE